MFCSNRPADVKRKKDEEKNREVCLTNRQRVELFKKVLKKEFLYTNILQTPKLVNFKCATRIKLNSGDFIYFF